MDVKTIGVIGATTLGRGIAYAAAAGGYRTVLEDVSSHRLDDGVAYIRQTLDASVARGKMTSDQRKLAVANLAMARSVEDVCREADLLIEAAPEDMEMQLEIFTLFDKFAKPEAILASSATSLSIAELAAITFCPENCVGLRFLHPVPETKRLEIVRAPATSEATVQACLEVVRRMGKEAVVVGEPAGSSAGAKGSSPG
jgi:3-hydroxybutyryl-CoA dehydrogenase